MLAETFPAEANALRVNQSLSFLNLARNNFGLGSAHVLLEASERIHQSWQKCL